VHDYFICQNKVGKNRPFTHLKLILLLVINHGAQYVSRKQIGGELDARKFSADGRSQRLDRQGFGQARNALEQYMPLGQQANQQAFQHVFLSHDGLVQFKTEQVNEGTFLIYLFIQQPDIGVHGYEFL